ncbi:MAG: Ig-like domain-containing protein [Acidobacteriota bacterium]
MFRIFALLLCLAYGGPSVWASGACNTGPVANSDVVQVGYASFHLFDPLANDTDVDGDRLTLISITAAPSCQGVTAIDGPIARYTPNGLGLPGGATSCTATYTVGDGAGSSMGTVTLIFPPELIFSDDFETGNTTEWDVTVPGS